MHSMVTGRYRGSSCDAVFKPDTGVIGDAESKSLQEKKNNKKAMIQLTVLGLEDPSSQYSKIIKIKSINHSVKNHRYGPATVRKIIIKKKHIRGRECNKCHFTTP